MYSDTSRNPWGSSSYTENNLDELQKAIHEQKILLAALEDDVDTPSHENIQAIKQRILSVHREINEKQLELANKGRATHHNPAQWWARYQLNLRQLEEIADQRRTLEKEIDYLVGTSIKNLEEELRLETEKLNEMKSKSSHMQRVSSSGIFDTYGISDSDRIRAKAQAMVAARLKKSNSTSTASSDEFVYQKTLQINNLMDQVKQTEREIKSIIINDLSKVNEDLMSGTKELKDRQMFEQGLYVDDAVARFIDDLNQESATILPPIPSLYSQPPPPIPTSQRPGTPRSESDIKAEAHKRIEERRRLFVKNVTKIPLTTEDKPISNEERAAQERMRQAEADARARLEAMREKRNKLRKEAKEAEEKKRKAAEEAAAAAEAEMLAEKKRKQQEEQERLARIKRAQDELAEKQRKQQEEEQRKARQEQEERERKEAEEKRQREEKERIAQEERQRKARKAAEQAALEKRMRRVEIERREQEIEAARQEEIDRRRRWEEQERQKQLEEEQRIIEKEEEAARIRRILEEEEQAKAEEQRRIEEERQKRLEMENELRRKREEQRRLEEQRALEAEKKLREKEEEKKAQQQQQQKYYTSSPVSMHSYIQNSTTAGTSGYGVDVEDEVNFSTVYRVNTLYEYQGVREDDLSFSANETLKAHPSKDKASDWWYGTSLVTNQIGFFPRTYVEVVEEAFRVKTLYAFKKSRSDDLGFPENEVILVQPFQDEESDWWYGTNEETEESGYFPKTYVEKIDSASTNNHLSSLAIPIAISSNSNPYLSLPDHDQHRGLSAPNTPIMKKTNLGINKIELSKRRRAASSVSTAEHSHISTPQLLLPRSGSVSENLELLTWSSTMDPIELEVIPPEERKRQEAIFELIATERSYLSDLQMIINVFYTDSGKYLSQDERDVVFSNIDDLLICNTALLSDMETRQREQANVIDKIGDVFLKHADGLKCYSSYCRNQSYATKFLQKKREQDQWFEVFLKTAQTRTECRSLDLSHFLLQPVQRITRYPLLLRQILNSTPKKHPDYSLVRSALSIAQRVLEDVNEETRRFENNQKMLELSRILDMEATGRLNIPGREFVMDSPLYKAKSGRKLHGFLFNDILILAEPLKSLSPKGYLYSLYREPMALERVSVRQQQTINLKPSFASSNSDDLSFQIVTGTHVTAVKTSTATLRKQWMSQIQHYSALQQYK